MAGGVYFLVGLPLTLRGFRRGMAAVGGAPSRSPALFGMSALAGMTGQAFALACAIGWPATAIPTLYLTALIGTLGIGAVNFTGFVFTIDKA